MKYYKGIWRHPAPKGGRRIWWSALSKPIAHMPVEYCIPCAIGVLRGWVGRLAGPANPVLGGGSKTGQVRVRYGRDLTAW